MCVMPRRTEEKHAWVQRARERSWPEREMCEPHLHIQQLTVSVWKGLLSMRCPAFVCVLFSPHKEMEVAGVCAIGFGSCQYVEIKAGCRALCLVSMKRASEAMGWDDTVQRM